MAISFYAGLLAFISYAGFALLLLLRGKQSRLTYLLAFAAAMTAVWGISTGLADFGGPQWQWTRRAIVVLRDAGWLAVMIGLLRQACDRETLWRRLAFVAGALAVLDLMFAVSGILVDLGVGLLVTFTSVHLALSVMGLILVENLVRNLPAQSLWSNKQLLIALGAVFAYNIVLRIPQFLIGASPDFLATAQPLIYVVVLPLMVVAAVRDTSLRLQVHSSRNFVFHSATLISAGILLQGTALAAFYVRRFGGTPGTVLSIVLGFSGLIALVVAASSHTVRSKIKTFINENFFSYKYDYRLEWTKFINALAQYEEHGGPERALRTLADLLDSTGGVLWVRRSGWQQFVPLAHWADEENFGPIQSTDPALAPLQDNDVAFLDLGSADDMAGREIWRERVPSAWLVVPLRFRGELTGIAVLQKPRAPRRLDWEDRNLVSLISMQLAAQLVHEHTAQALADTQQLAEFNNRVTFALHDLKNTAGQLGLLLHNAEQFGDDADFRADMMDTIKRAEENLRALITKLRDGDAAATIDPKQGEGTDVCELVTRFAQGKRRSRVVFTGGGDQPAYAVVSAPGALEKALEHVVANAVEASPPGGEVRLAVEQTNGCIRVLVRDDGPGMSAEFIANDLFRPLRTTKNKGLGIGAYQARELMRSLGGGIDVQSSPGAGTTVCLFLPVASTSENRATT